MPNKIYNNFKNLRELLNEVNNKETFSDFDFLLDESFSFFLNHLELNDIEEYDFSKGSCENDEMRLGESLKDEKFNESDCLFKKLRKYHFSGYNQDTSEIDTYIDKFIDFLFASVSLNLDEAGTNLLIYELMINIYIHSEFQDAYVFCQNIRESNEAALCIVDDGITIPGSLEECDRYFKNDSNAIYEAINGCSSDISEEGLIGRGLNTCTSLISLGFGGELLIASRNGFCIVKDKTVYNFAFDNFCIKGTMLCLKLNNAKLNSIYDYVKRIHFEKVDVCV